MTGHFKYLEDLFFFLSFFFSFFFLQQLEDLSDDIVIEFLSSII